MASATPSGAPGSGPPPGPGAVLPPAAGVPGSGPRTLVVRDPARAQVLLEPTRLRLLEALDAPSSAPRLAERLGLPRQRVGYHLRALEAAGLVELVEERRRRNCLERVVRRTASRLVLAPELLGALGGTPAAGAPGPGAGARFEREVRLGSRAEREAFAEELRRRLEELVARWDRPRGSERLRVVAGTYAPPETPSASP